MNSELRWTSSSHSRIIPCLGAYRLNSKYHRITQEKTIDLCFLGLSLEVNADKIQIQIREGYNNSYHWGRYVSLNTYKNWFPSFLLIFWRLDMNKYMIKSIVFLVPP